MEKEEQILRKLAAFQTDFEGEILADEAIRLIYATDASAYREVPLAVTYPKNNNDLKKLIRFAAENRTSLIPRTAGTSLAGQVVGNGIVVDVSKHFGKILEINAEEHWVRVQPGVVLDELNKALAPKGLFFAPETSTSSRCMMAGMLGNNSCGAHALVYGSTRDHTLEVKTLLSDGSEAVFGPLTTEEFHEKCNLKNKEGELYRKVRDILQDKEVQKEITEQFPVPELKRRNTGYALDLLMQTDPFVHNDIPFNFSRLLAGSEGTLAFTTEIKLNLVPLPPENKALVCVHLDTVAESLKANLIALKYKPYSIELMDRVILELTRENIEQRKNRFFVKGNPGAILIVEFAEEKMETIRQKAEAMEKAMRQAGLGYHFPMVTGENIDRVWDLRKAGLGILGNMPGDSKPVPVTEDTAVLPELLPDYIAEFEETILHKYNKEVVYYAHISTGELHIRPVLNLKDPKDVELFYKIGKETALLVKKYRGSLSGEHGDGRLRGEFIPLMVGDKIYSLFKEIKHTWDPDNIFNPGKITDTPRMNTFLRYKPGQETPEIKTYFDFSKDLGIVRAAEKCNGTGLCRKSEVIGGTMCPSYMATRDEDKTTRARANILREFISKPNQKNPFDHEEIYRALDLCLMCKGCKSECPSSVDMTKLKAEFLQHYYEAHGVPLRSRLIANIAKVNKLGSLIPSVYNFVQKNNLLSGLNAKIFGFAPQRKFPLLSKITLDKWMRKNGKNLNDRPYPNGKVYLFNDEFTRFNDTDTGIKAILLLTKLGYQVVLPKSLESARTYLSKGLVKKAKAIANANVRMLKDLISDETPLVGIEPSAILTFRDEYLDLADKNLRDAAEKLAKNALMIDEFLEREIKAGKIKKEQFTRTARHIKLHGHCHQKSLASTRPTLFVLGFPENYTVEEIPSGCCGMAGAFGYEKEHYDLSMKVGELVLFPAVRNSSKETLIAAPGTSCRHQIKDGTDRTAFHPVEILYDALRETEELKKNF
ncbi:MAG TPA: FAD-binding oxidoreductase [Bacteroidetes bacterium]|nr:FAD-binding oxidoreductase [Bacteroidota bacterium]